MLCIAVCALLGACGLPRPTTGRPGANALEARACSATHALDCCPETPALGLCRLIAELIDLRALTHLPNPPYASHMASSFDRSSQSARPGEPGWFANRDFAQLRADEPLVLLDARGPGVVTRIWSANPTGVLRVYLDGSSRPALEAPMRELLRGEFGPFAPPLAFEAARGTNFYVPIAFNERCSITVTSEKDRKLYYQVSYRSYAPGVQVERFDAGAFANANGRVQQLVRLLNGPYYDASLRTNDFELDTARANTFRLSADPGGSLLRELRVRVPHEASSRESAWNSPLPAASAPAAAATAPPLAASAPDQTSPPARRSSQAALRLLRENVLEIWVDGERTVRVPLGDFFGTAPGLQAVNALAFGVDAERGELVSRWPMPFARELRVTLIASGSDALRAHFEVRHEAQPFGPDTLFFHALWHAPEFHPSEPNHDFTLAELHGDGLFVGTLLNVANPLPAWWGEGDEKIWIDQDRFPSFFGTGTEDYFGYAYCSNQRFSESYIGQTLSGERANFGRSSLYRIHAADPIRFTRQLRFDLEVNHWAKAAEPVGYDGIVYFYARPGARATPLAADSQFRLPAFDAPEPDVPARPYHCGG